MFDILKIIFSSSVSAGEFKDIKNNISVCGVMLDIFLEKGSLMKYNKSNNICHDYLYYMLFELPTRKASVLNEMIQIRHQAYKSVLWLI